MLSDLGPHGRKADAQPAEWGICSFIAVRQALSALPTHNITSASSALPRLSLLPSPNVFTLCHLYASLGGARVVSARACASCSVPSRTKSRESHVPVLPLASGALTSFLSSIVSLKECRGNNPFRMLQVSLPLMFPTNVSPKNTCM